MLLKIDIEDSFLADKIVKILEAFKSDGVEIIEIIDEKYCDKFDNSCKEQTDESELDTKAYFEHSANIKNNF